jgi:hypothetical protein
MLLVMIIMTVRACGGAAVTEDRLGAATRWTAEKVGLANKKDAFDAKVRPPLAAATRSISDGVYAGISHAMDNVDMAADGFGNWTMQHLRAALGLVDNSLAPVLAPKPPNESKPLDPNEERQRRESRSR